MATPVDCGRVEETHFIADFVARTGLIRYPMLWVDCASSDTTCKRCAEYHTQLGGVTEFTKRFPWEIFLFTVSGTESSGAGVARRMGNVGYLLFELALALAARRGRGSFRGLLNLCVFSLATTLDGIGCNCFISWRGRVVDLNSSFT